MSEPSKAVFLSYASQDAEAAKRICDALRQAGVEVWFDAEGGLEHGDEWDQKIRRQIKECVLFIPVISANTQARHEGYFRVEWDLAAERARGIASGVAFILPVVIDDTREPDALVPDRFRAVQWTKLPDGAVTPEVQVRYLKLWSHRTGVLKHEAASASVAPVRAAPSAAEIIRKPGAKAYALIAVAIAGIVAGAGRWMSHRSPAPAASVASVQAPATAAKPTVSETDQLVARAYALFEKMSYTRDNLAAAEDLTRRATEIASDSAHAWAGRAFVQSCYVLRGWDVSEKRRQDTQTFANRALALNPNETDAMLALTYVLNQQGGFVQAEALARRALAVGPDSYRLHSTLIAAVGGQGRLEEAFKLAAENVRLFPREPLTHYGLALGHLRLGHMEEGLASFEAALAVQPFASALLQKAVLLVSLRGDLAAARVTLNQVAPEDRTEDRAVGIAMWLALVEHNPARVHEAAALTARSYFEDNMVPGAKAWFTALAYQLDGKESLARQQWQAAESVLRQRLRDHPDSTEDHARLAITLARLARDDEAAREIAPLEAMMREQPNLVSAILLAKYYAALGQAAKAAPYLAQAIDRVPFVSRSALRLDPQWDKLRGQPEFDALLAEAGKETAAIPAPDTKSVAVLAFANLSDDKANEYFSDGISEELLNVLAKIPGLKVTARTSSFHFKGKDTAIKEIAQQLGVAYVVEGSVRKQGDKVRITAQLIKAADGFHVWSDTFTRDLKDIFAVQEEIAGLIATNLSLKLGTASPAAAIDPDTYGFYLAARQILDLRTLESFDRAEALFTQVIKRAPKFARGYAARAETLYLRAGFKRETGLWTQRDLPVFASLAKDLESALQLEPNLPEAVAVRGLLNGSRWRVEESIRDFRRAIELNPNYALARLWLGIRWWAEGRVPEARTEMLRAAELDPMSASIASACSAFLHDTGYAAESLEHARRAMALQPDGQRPKMVLAHALALNGRMEEALALARKELSGSDPWQPSRYFRILAMAGFREEAERIYREMGRGYDVQMKAAALAALGRWPEFFEAWQVESVNSQAPFPLYDPLYDPVRKDPRFLAVLNQIGLGAAHERAQTWLAAHPPEKPEVKK